ncbi:MAG: hypothetical protein F6K09_05435 [Merismopedia sp. SIO2A8]|nr:hypothetical protein [Merismopedia sp. SIO2A8]
MKVFIEETIEFASDLDGLELNEKAAVIQSIEQLVSSISCSETNPEAVCHTSLAQEFRSPELLLDLGDYNASLFIFNVTDSLTLILSIDDDPIFEQHILTLFRAVELSQVEQVYQAVATSLYQALPQTNSALAKVA